MKKIVVLGGIALLALAGCNAKTKEAAVPNVIGQRLDVAQAHVKDAGLKSEAIGGGTFGIIDESNWTVCQTEPAAGATGAKNVRLIVDRVCTPTKTAASTDSSATTAPTTADSSTSTTADSSTTTTSATGGVQAAPKIRAPNVVGKDLQTAQDTMQAAGLYVLTSHDSTGLGRLQVLDRNWLVTEQSPKAGTMVDKAQLIDLGARKFSD